MLTGITFRAMSLASFAGIIAKNRIRIRFEGAWTTVKEAVALVAKGPRR